MMMTCLSGNGAALTAPATPAPLRETREQGTVSISEIITRFNEIPYSVLQKFIEDTLDDSRYGKFHEASVAAMGRHDPKGFRADYIMREIFCGDYDEIVRFLDTNAKLP